MANDSPTVSRVERVLAYMIAAAVGLSIICFVAVIIGTAAGATSDQFSSGLWPVIIVLPAIGLPLGLLLIIALIIVAGIRRGRETKDARR